MNHGLQVHQPGYADGAVSSGQRNRVLRNTYWLLALSMIPTVLGDDLWAKAIRHYVEKHRGGSVITPDLQRAISARQPAGRRTALGTARRGLPSGAWP